MRIVRRWRRTTWARWTSNALLAAGTVTTVYLAPVVAWALEIVLWGGGTALLTAILLERRNRLPAWGSVALTSLLLPLALGGAGAAGCAGRRQLALVASLLVALSFVLLRRASAGVAWRRGTLVGLLSLGFLGKVGVETLLVGGTVPQSLAALGALAPQHLAGAMVGGILVVAATTSVWRGEPCPES